MPDPEEFDAVSAIEALLNKAPEPDPAPDETDTPEPPEEAPEPAQETETDESEPSAEVEGATLDTKTAEPEAKAVKAGADEPAPKTAETKSEPDPQEQILSQLNTLVPQLQATFYSEFADIKSDADLYKVGQEDPARYNRFVMMQGQLGRALNQQRELESAKQQRFLQSQVGILQKDFPEYVDPVKGAAIRAEYTAFAKKRGFTEDRMRSASAAEILTLRDAMAWEKHQAAEKAKPAQIAAAQAKAKDKAAQAPKVQKPGAPEVNRKGEREKERLQQFAKSGHINDLATLLETSGMA